MSEFPAAPAATPDVGDDPDRTPEGDVLVPLVPLSCGGWGVADGRREGKRRAFPDTRCRHRTYGLEVATMFRTRTIGRIAVAIGTGIAAVAISLTAPDIASARPRLCDFDCAPPPPPPVDPNAGDPTFPPMPPPPPPTVIDIPPVIFN